MRAYGNRVLVSTGLLLGLLAISSLTPMLSSELQSRVIGSSGSITYPSATLHVTDSTPEGPVPFTIDGQSGYDTGGDSYYTISAGVHTIELPSPYTSPISDVTYYFSYWEDDSSADNPRTITFEANEIRNLFGVYSTSPDVTPPTEPPEPPPGEYLAYTGWESYSAPSGRLSGSIIWDDLQLQSWEQARVYYSSGYHTAEVVSYDDAGFSASNRPPNAGNNILKWSATGSSTYRSSFELYNIYNPLYTDLYYTHWIYFPSSFINALDWSTFGAFFEMKGHPWEGSSNWFAPYYNAIENFGGNPNWRLQIYHPTLGGVSYIADWSFYEDYVVGHPLEGWGSGYTGVVPYAEVEPWPLQGVGLPSDRWFKVEFYLHRATDRTGIFRMWITDPDNPDPSKRARRLLVGLTNIETATRDPATEWFTNNMGWSQLRHASGLSWYSDEYYVAVYPPEG